MSLEASGISKRIGRNWILRDVALDVGTAEVLGLLGPAGAGKTTLLRIIAGLEKASGSDASLSSASAVVLANPAQRSFFRVLLGRSFDRAAEKQAAFETALAETGKAVLFDDLFSGLDPAICRENAERLRRWAAESNVSSIYASNDFRTIAAVCDRVSVMIGGQIRQTGSPEEVYEMPSSVAVAAVTGRCNLIEARRLTSSKSPIPEFQTIDGSFHLLTEKADLGMLGALNRNVWLAIRPEHISISFGASFPEDNLLKAVVRDARFYGPTTLIRFNAGGLALEAVVPRLVGLSAGDECMIGLPPDRIRILKD